LQAFAAVLPSLKMALRHTVYCSLESSIFWQPHFTRCCYSRWCKPTLKWIVNDWRGSTLPPTGRGVSVLTALVSYCCQSGNQLITKHMQSSLKQKEPHLSHHTLSTSFIMNSSFQNYMGANVCNFICMILGLWFTKMKEHMTGCTFSLYMYSLCAKGPVPGLSFPQNKLWHIKIAYLLWQSC
jgi:hypothetical protein